MSKDHVNLDDSNWEEEFDKEFYEGLYGCSESDGKYYPDEDRVKKFIRDLLHNVRGDFYGALDAARGE